MALETVERLLCDTSTAGTSRTLTRTRPAPIDARSISGQQTGDPLDLGYATHTIAHNITLARSPQPAARSPQPAARRPATET